MEKLNLLEYGTLKNADSKYLYRGLNKEEVDAGIKLIPKGIHTFEDLKLVAANTSGYYEYRNLGPILSVLNHNQELPTSGVSASTDKEIAIGYAMSSPPEKQYVVMINREKARLLGIKEKVVKDVLPLWAIKKPDDEEVILTYDAGIFPKEIIKKVYKITESSLTEQVSKEA